MEKICVTETFSKQDQEKVSLIFNSFLHTQGSAEFHEYIFDYLKERGYLSQITMEEKIPQRIFNNMRKPKQHKQIEDTTFIEEIGKAWDILNKYVTGVYGPIFKEKPVEEGSIPYIAGVIAFFDRQYQEKVRVRNTENPAIQMTDYDSIRDPHASHIRRYAKLGFDAGHPGFNHMYRDINDYFSNNPEAVSLTKLVTAWQPNHPGVNFFEKNPDRQSTKSSTYLPKKRRIWTNLMGKVKPK
jgi:hypothetical protein